MGVKLVKTLTSRACDSHDPPLYSLLSYLENYQFFFSILYCLILRIISYSFFFSCYFHFEVDTVLHLAGLSFIEEV